LITNYCDNLILILAKISIKIVNYRIANKKYNYINYLLAN